MLESLERLKIAGALPAISAKSRAAPEKRPPSRHGSRIAGLVGSESDQDKPQKGQSNAQLSTTPSDRGPRNSKVSFAGPASESLRHNGGRDSRVTFQLSRNNSDDELMPHSHGSSGITSDMFEDGVSPEEALIRRIWESRIHAG